LLSSFVLLLTDFKSQLEKNPLLAVRENFNFKFDRIFEITKYEKEISCEEWDQVLEKAKNDLEFRNRLEADPFEAIKEAFNGYEFPFLCRIPENPFFEQGEDLLSCIEQQKGLFVVPGLESSTIPPDIPGTPSIPG